MELIRMLLGVDLRRRWRSWALLVLLLGGLTGVVMATFSGWQRTTTAMDRFLEHHRPHNAYVEGAFTREEVLAIDGVESATGGDYFLLVPVLDGEPRPELLGQISPFSFDDPSAFRETARPIVVAGRLADPGDASEVTIDELAADRFGAGPGDHITMRGYALDQADRLFESIGSLPPDGPTFELEVTGVVRAPQDVIPPPDVPDVVYLGAAEVYLGPAFDAAHRGKDVASLGALFGDLGEPGAGSFEIRIDPDRITREELTSAVQALDPEAFVDLSAGDAERARESARRAVSLQAGLVFALGVLLAGCTLVFGSLVLRRHLETDVEQASALRDLGLDARTSMRFALAKSLLLGVGSVLVAVVVAVALSPLTPVGYARRAEVDPGAHLSIPIVVGVAVAAVVLFAARVVTPVARRARRAHRAVTAPSSGVWLSDRAARAGFPPAVVSGVRAAVLGAGSVTVAGAVFLACAGIVGGFGFASSEARLAGDRDLWGWTFDAVVGDGNDSSVDEVADERLADDERISGYSIVHGVEALTVRAGDASAELDLGALERRKGAIGPRMLAGHAPAAPDEIALGGATARQLRVDVGDEVVVEGRGNRMPFRVTGLVVMNLGYDAERIGEGALASLEGLRAVEEETHAARAVVDLAPGVDVAEAYESLKEEWGNTVLLPLRPSDVERLHAVRHLPIWFSGLLAVLAVVTLAFVLVLTIRRRRRDLALLRTLGFDRRQLATTVAVQAVTLVVPTAVLGAVVGLAAGRVVWEVTVESLGAPLVQVVPGAALAAVLVGAAVVALGVAIAPARYAARTRPAEVLRAE